MSLIQSKISKSSPEYIENEIHHQALSKNLETRLNTVKKGGDPESVKKHLDRGKLTARSRIETLLDSGSAFLEIGALAADGVYDSPVPSAGMVAGIGCVHGREIMVIANDATVKGGTYFPLTVKKHLRAQEIASENNLPCVYLVDSGGAFLPLQSEVFPDRDHFGRIFYNQAGMSARGIPQISAVMGSCTAGGAYVPAMSDENVIVNNQGTIFLGGPPLVKAATGETVTAEELGGGEVHTKMSGVCDHLAENDEDALMIVRDILFNVNRTPRFDSSRIPTVEPVYPESEFAGIVSKDLKKPFDIREIIARLVDGSKFHEFKQRYGSTLVCGFAHLHGFPIGIIANNGILFSESALKGAHFIELCEQRKIPLLFLQNITGFMVGKKYENGGIARDGAKLVTAVSTCSVPKLTVVVGGSYGAGNYGMCGRAFQPRFLWMWPNARISVMGGEQAAQVLSQVKVEQLKAKGKTLTEQEVLDIQNPIRDLYETEGSPYYSTARLWDDGVIVPWHTRQTLAMALSAISNAGQSQGRFGVFRM